MTLLVVLSVVACESGLELGPMYLWLEVGKHGTLGITAVYLVRARNCLDRFTASVPIDRWAAGVIKELVVEGKMLGDAVLYPILSLPFTWKTPFLLDV